jgi:transcriptional regulator with XRE-family HTH domain
MPRKNTTEDGPHPIDAHVGQKVRARRQTLDMSQDDLAQACGITFQQVQKYERGTNRIAVSRLVEIAKALKTPLDYFLDGSFQLLPGQKYAVKGFAEGKQPALEPDPMASRDVRDLVRAYQSIKDAKLQKQLVEMAKTMASSGGK